MLPAQIENFIGLKVQGWQAATLCPLAWLPRMEVSEQQESHEATLN